jgi:uncharacterized protein YceH (UPF0502 family)
VLNLSEEEVRQALRSLEDMGLTSVVRESRVAKYEHRIRTVLNLRRDETALLCLLFLRGPQTPGELRSRSDRLHSFDGLDAVESTLARMTAPSTGEEPSGARPLAVVLPRQPGSRESRYAHLLGGPIDTAVRDSISADLRPRNPSAIEQVSDSAAESATAARISALEVEVVALRAAVAQLQESLAQLESRLNDGPPAADTRTAQRTP